MRLTLCLTIVALAAAAPASAQNTAEEAPTNDVADVNAVAANDANAVAPGTPTDVTATPAPLPPEDDAAADTARPRDDGKRFPWGVIGLLGLIGLLGRRRSES